MEKDREGAEMAKKVMKTLKDVEKKRPQNCQSRKMGRKKEKSKMVASCGFLEDEFVNAARKKE